MRLDAAVGHEFDDEAAGGMGDPLGVSAVGDRGRATVGHATSSSLLTVC
jgi:hypothetical protein